MAHYTEEQIRQARSIDLFTYLQTYEPTELIHVSGDTWCTREHDSLKVSGATGKWMWWSRGFGGTSALDYLIKVRGMQFPDAMKRLTEGAMAPVFYEAKQAGENAVAERKQLILPDKADSSKAVIRYLTGRGIDGDIVRECIREGLIYESLPYHNAVFVGYDETGNAAYACYRGTSDKRFMGDASGSCKTYSFRVEGTGSRIHVFESAIDLLSFATIMQMKTGRWRAETMVSLGGVYAPSLNRPINKTPAALANALQNHPEVNTVVLHLDNDDAGRGAAEAITRQLSERYVVRNEPSPVGKDINDYLMYIRKRQREWGHSRQLLDGSCPVR